MIQNDDGTTRQLYDFMPHAHYSPAPVVIRTYHFDWNGGTFEYRGEGFQAFLLVKILRGRGEHWMHVDSVDGVEVYRPKSEL